VAQSSGPIGTGTTAERQFSDVLWRDLFGQEPGVLADMNGSSYALTLPGSGDVVSVGSTTQASLALVAGFLHRIPQSSPDTITIPAASGSARTDIIALRYDPSYTGAPGPVRLFRIAGSGSSLPAYDASPGGIEEMPLFSITRSPGQALSLATTQKMYPRLAPTLDLPAGAPLPTNSPLGTRVYQGTSSWRRALDGTNNPVWISTSAAAAEEKHGGATVTSNSSGYFTITHNLGVVPTYASAISREAGAVDTQHFANAAPSGTQAVTATTATFRAYYNGALQVSQSFPIWWEVKA
jgi:hypothetical protein